jgi:two-component system cell cycle sensor histidine kinase/response regulator CckA
VSEDTREKPAVLIIDDEDMIRDLIAATLEETGLDFLKASGGVEARRIFAEHESRIRIVLLDLSMPDTSASDLFDDLTRDGTDARFVLMSGYSEEESRARLGRDGIAAFLQKPFRVDAIVKLVTELAGT